MWVTFGSHGLSVFFFFFFFFFGGGGTMYKLLCIYLFFQTKQLEQILKFSPCFVPYHPNLSFSLILFNSFPRVLVDQKMSRFIGTST